jgi:excisionase family DNA binding protein
MSRISVAEAADRLGVNVQRVHQRIADGSLAAERIGRQWTIDDADVARLDHRTPGRPPSSRSAWAMVLVAAADGSDRALTPVERSRARARLRQLLSAAEQVDPGRDEEEAAAELAGRLRSLLGGRARRRLFRVSARDRADLRGDDRVALSGVSLPASGIASADVVEAYVADHLFESLVDDFLLVGAGHRDADVVLHVVDPAALRHREVVPASWLLLAADLAEHQRPRETARAVQVVREAAGPGVEGVR